MAENNQSPSGSISISWSAVTGGSAIIGVAAITALVIVAAIKKVDTLSAVALSLAILAFMTQIMVFTTQTWSTSKLKRGDARLLGGMRYLPSGRSLTTCRHPRSASCIGSLATPTRSTATAAAFRAFQPKHRSPKPSRP